MCRSGHWVCSIPSVSVEQFGSQTFNSSRPLIRCCTIQLHVHCTCTCACVMYIHVHVYIIHCSSSCLAYMYMYVLWYVGVPSWSAKLEPHVHIQACGVASHCHPLSLDCTTLHRIHRPTTPHRYIAECACTCMYTLLLCTHTFCNVYACTFIYMYMYNLYTCTS